MNQVKQICGQELKLICCVEGEIFSVQQVEKRYIFQIQWSHCLTSTSAKDRRGLQNDLNLKMSDDCDQDTNTKALQMQWMLVDK